MYSITYSHNNTANEYRSKTHLSRYIYEDRENIMVQRPHAHNQGEICQLGKGSYFRLDATDKISYKYILCSAKHATHFKKNPY